MNLKFLILLLMIIESVNSLSCYRCKNREDCKDPGEINCGVYGSCMKKETSDILIKV